MKITMLFKVELELDEAKQREAMEHLGIDDLAKLPAAVSASFTEQLCDDSEPGMTMTLVSMEAA